MPAINLSPEQRAAVEDPARIVLVRACPGAGKTRVLAAAAAGSLSGEWALCLTFTRRAAGELRERLGRTGRSYIGTLHGWCYDLIRQHHAALGYRDERIVVLDRHLQRRYAERVVDGVVGGCGAPQLLSEMERRGAGLPRDSRLDRMVELYRGALLGDNAADYGLLIIEATRLFNLDPGVLGAHARQYARVLVDEAQDLDPAQWRLLYCLMIANPELRMLLVGDADQCCYEWRGASGLPTWASSDACVCHELSINYRSAPSLVWVTQGLIGPQTWRTSAMRSISPPPGAQRLGVIEGWPALASWAEARSRDGTGLSIAFLARTNEGVLELCQHVRAAGVQVERIAPDSHQDETWGMMASLLWWELPRWRAAGEAAMGLEGVGEIGRREVWRTAEETGLGAIEVASERHAPVRELYEGWADLGLSARLIAVAGRASRRGGRLPAAYNKIAAAYADYAASTDLGQRSAYGLWARMADHEPQRSQSRLQAMTFHAAKGLEFDIVVLGRMGSIRRPTLGESPAERRLLYVAATRARSQLWVVRTGEDNPLIAELIGLMQPRPALAQGEPPCR